MIKFFKTGIFSSLLFLMCCAQTPEFSGDSSFGFLQKQVDFGPRNPGSEGHTLCRDWLAEELGKYADRVVKQSFMHVDTRLDTTIQMTNIVASFNLNAGKRILLCAHYDTRPVADRDIAENRNKPILGANDGASGVAVLLEIARVMSFNKPTLGVDIVLFDGEDYGPEGKLDEYFLGARYFAKNLNGYLPYFGILLDMVGDTNLNIPYEYNSKQNAGRFVEMIWSTAEELGYTQFEHRMGHSINDDHIPLIEAGIPMVDIIDFDYPDASQSYWHTMQDLPDKCSPASLKAVGQTVLAVVYDQE